jgi:tetratricopeptide (TPR) repeat protein
VIALEEGGSDLQDRIRRGLPLNIQDRLADLFEELCREGDEDNELVDDVTLIGWVGDEGGNAANSFAAALWLVDHAGLFLRTIKSAYERQMVQLGEDPTELSQKIIAGLASEIGLPYAEKMKLLSKLLIDIGISLQPDSEDWEDNSKKQIVEFARKASYSFSGGGQELYVLPWAFDIEFSRQQLSLEERVKSLSKLINAEVRQHRVSELELNNWAYFLLSIGRWRSATPMAQIAVNMARIPRNLDTLGWAYYFEGRIEEALLTLNEVVYGQTLESDSDWPIAAFHQFSVLISVNEKARADSLLRTMFERAPESYWTSKARNLEPLLSGQRDLASTRSRRTEQKFEYDVALSFAEDDRGIVERLAVELTARGVRVFYDEFERASLWGKNLYSYLIDLYYSKSRYCITFISKNYVSRRWTNLEREAAQARTLSEDQEYILPIRLDDTSVPGFLPTIAYLDWDRDGIERIVQCVLWKLEQPRSKWTEL